MAFLRLVQLMCICVGAREGSPEQLADLGAEPFAKLGGRSIPREPKVDPTDAELEFEKPELDSVSRRVPAQSAIDTELVNTNTE